MASEPSAADPLSDAQSSKFIRINFVPDEPQSADICLKLKVTILVVLEELRTCLKLEQPKWLVQATSSFTVDASLEPVLYGDLTNPDKLFTLPKHFTYQYPLEGAFNKNWAVPTDCTYWGCIIVYGSQWQTAWSYLQFPVFFSRPWYAPYHSRDVYLSNISGID